MRAELLTEVLNELNGTSAEVEASAAISIDGLTMAALVPAAMDEHGVGATSAAILSLGARAAQELVRGNLEQVLVKGTGGHALMIGAAREAVLAILAKSNARLGLIFFDVRRAAESIVKLI